MNLMWFRADFRLQDNPALHHAMSDGPTLAIFFITAQQWRQHKMSAAKQSLLLRQLQSLAEQLAQINVPLHILNCDTFAALPYAMAEFAQQCQISQVFCNTEYEVNEAACETEVRRTLQSLDISLQSFHDQCAIAPGKIKTLTGEDYKVFTPFKRAWLKAFEHSARPCWPKPKAQRPLVQNAKDNFASDLRALTAHRALLGKSTLDKPALETSTRSHSEAHWQTLWPAGEDEAQARLKRFCEQSIDTYHQYRDIPSLEGTSALSPYLALGIISARQCIDASAHFGALQQDSQQLGASTWLNELIWRDFYRHVMVAHPHICKFKPFKSATDQLPWRHDPKHFQAWCEGATGYPLVDAAMRQLAQTGWMHNRLRMVVAMFLCKHLFIDWRLGEAYFMEQLVDGDLASNNGGWQWSASTGVDAVPYFRIFNPTRQSQRFDPDGTFIRRYLAELAELDNKSIHQPNSFQAAQCNYPLPIVDHASAVAQTKSWFKALT
ncbi:cryptochrome/photolyase family protein [Teredinibacter waterburyi]|uniref:cryptochrome/photolyase family protein n=1 Tax=Teredinibacter waterburyi TaxID=1500538 RepID=UPI00165ED1DB|nr:FAD-binding domain-containing protein [Teredinibacter waterburyi]